MAERHVVTLAYVRLGPPAELMATWPPRMRWRSGWAHAALSATMLVAAIASIVGSATEGPMAPMAISAVLSALFAAFLARDARIWLGAGARREKARGVRLAPPSEEKERTPPRGVAEGAR